MTRLALLLACITAAGCAHSAPEYHARVRVESAQLVAVNPDVKTVADSDQPLFFSRGFFWLFHDGAWWRGERVTSNVWVKVENPPVPVVQILNPYAFTNYRDATATHTAVNETKAAPVLQQSLVQPSRPDQVDDKARKPSETATPNERSTDPSDPAATTSDKPSF